MAKDRRRFMDVSKLTTEQIENLSKEIGKKISDVLKEAQNKANLLLNIYGLQIKIGYDIVPIDKEEANKK